MLVLGGTGFIGRSFCQLVTRSGTYQVTILNRGLTNPDLFSEQERLKADREDAGACAAALVGRHFDVIVDFSCSLPQHVENILKQCSCDYYVFLSSSAVELSWPEDELFHMAQNKLWCEQLVTNACPNCLIVRPGFVVGDNDISGRFEKRGPHWFWRGTEDYVRPLIEVDFLANTMLQLIQLTHTGIMRAGYSQPRVTMNLRQTGSSA